MLQTGNFFTLLFKAGRFKIEIKFKITFTGFRSEYLSVICWLLSFWKKKIEPLKLPGIPFWMFMARFLLQLTLKFLMLFAFSAGDQSAWAFFCSRLLDLIPS